MAPFVVAYLQGTKADVVLGDLLSPGRRSNYGDRAANYVYMTQTMDAAVWGAELALGEGPGRIYVVEPTGAVDDDPNVTDKRFPGNPTRSFRTRDAVRVVGEVVGWEGHPAEQLDEMRSRVAEAVGRGVEIDD